MYQTACNNLQQNLVFRLLPPKLPQTNQLEFRNFQTKFMNLKSAQRGKLTDKIIRKQVSSLIYKRASMNCKSHQTWMPFKDLTESLIGSSSCVCMFDRILMRASRMLRFVSSQWLFSKFRCSSISFFMMDFS